MSIQSIPEMKSPIEEPPNPGNPTPERRRKRKRSTDTEKPAPRPLRDQPSPEVPHNPQDVPEQEL
jgi:hypothetical protein